MREADQINMEIASLVGYSAVREETYSWTDPCNRKLIGERADKREEAPDWAGDYRLMHSLIEEIAIVHGYTLNIRYAPYTVWFTEIVTDMDGYGYERCAAGPVSGLTLLIALGKLATIVMRREK